MVRARHVAAMFTVRADTPTIVDEDVIFDETVVAEPSQEVCSVPVSVRLPVGVRPQQVRFVASMSS